MATKEKFACLRKEGSSLNLYNNKAIFMIKSFLQLSVRTGARGRRASMAHHRPVGSRVSAADGAGTVLPTAAA